ncbi:CARDB domain-containing protein [Chloroflexota bacterium]
MIGKVIYFLLAISLVLNVGLIGCADPIPIAKTVPIPASKPSPAPKPAPEPSPAPKPAPEPSPAPKPAPEPSPAPEPVPEPKPAPTPTTGEPDLVIESISYRPLNVSLGETATFTVIIKNNGGGNAAASSIYYYVDNSEIVSRDISAIPSGGMVEEIFTWRVARLTHNVKAIVDHQEEVHESDETNNEKRITCSVQPDIQPDLVIHDISFSPSNPVPGQTVDSIVSIRNIGEGKAGSFVIAHYVDGSKNGSNVVPTLSAGATVAITFTWEMEESEHTIKAVADYKDDVSEVEETNNEKGVTISSESGVDLVVYSITRSPEDPKPDSAVTYTIYLKNQGSGNAAPSTVYFYIGTHTKKDLPVPSIPAGGTARALFSTNFQTGETVATATADYYDAVEETDEDNNSLEEDFLGPSRIDLAIQNISWSPGNPSVGDVITFTVTIKNQGGLESDSFDVLYYIDGDYLERDLVSSLAAEGETSTTFTWKAESGNHTIKANVEYSSSARDADASNDSKDIEFSGANFVDLVVQDITWEPLNPLPGEEFIFNVTVKNNGAGRAGAFQVNYYVDGSRRYFDEIISLSAGQTEMRSFSWIAEKKENTVKVIVDYNDDIYENNETNNEKIIVFPGASVYKPDLIVQEITWRPQNPLPGDTIAFYVTVKNQSLGEASPFWAYYYINDMPGSSLRYFTIPGGGTLTQTFTLRAETGTHNLRIVANLNKELAESDYTNNDKEVTFIVE